MTTREPPQASCEEAAEAEVAGTHRGVGKTKAKAHLSQATARKPPGCRRSRPERGKDLPFRPEGLTSKEARAKRHCGKERRGNGEERGDRLDLEYLEGRYESTTPSDEQPATTRTATQRRARDPTERKRRRWSGAKDRDSCPVRPRAAVPRVRVREHERNRSRRTALPQGTQRQVKDPSA